MFSTLISADLPSEEAPGAAPNDHHAATHERITYTPARLLRTLHQVFEKAGVTDLAFVVIDGSVVYVDGDEADLHDLDQLLESARDEGYLNRELDELRVGLAHWEDGIQHVLDVRARAAVPVGEHELMITVSSHPDDFHARRLDDAQRYASRLREIAGDPEVVGGYRRRVEHFVERIDAALRRTLFRRDVAMGVTRLMIARPRLDDMVALQALPFGEAVEPTSYRVHPPDGTPDAWPDPALRIYHDRYFVFRHWVFLDALMNRSVLRYEWVEVVEPDGRVLFEGHKARWFESWPWGQKFTVRLVPEGGVAVDVHG